FGWWVTSLAGTGVRSSDQRDTKLQKLLACLCGKSKFVRAHFKPAFRNRTPGSPTLQNERTKPAITQRSAFEASGQVQIRSVVTSVVYSPIGRRHVGVPSDSGREKLWTYTSIP